MLIRPAKQDDIPAISPLAGKIWRDTYREILTPSQIEFMLNDMYSYESLAQQLDDGVCFLVVETGKNVIAFASYSLSDTDQSSYKIHKLYISPECQGKGVGTQLLDYVKEDVAKMGAKTLELNVNRKNSALVFYKRYGFSVVEEVDIPYHNYVLNDYIMRMPV